MLAIGVTIALAWHRKHHWGGGSLFLAESSGAGVIDIATDTRALLHARAYVIYTLCEFAPERKRAAVNGVRKYGSRHGTVVGWLQKGVTHGSNSERNI